MGQKSNYLAGQVLISRKYFSRLYACFQKMLVDQGEHLGSTTREVVKNMITEHEFDAVFDALGLTLHYDVYGNVINITVEEESQGVSYEHIVLPAIAEVVLDGSYLQMGNEDGTATKYSFNNGICTIETSEYLFPSVTLFVVVKNIYSSYFMGPDVSVCGAFTDMKQAQKRLKSVASDLREYVQNNISLCRFVGDIEMVESDTTFTLFERGAKHPLANVVIHKTNGTMTEEEKNG